MILRKLQEEDLVLQSTLTNNCVIKKYVSKNSMLELTTYEKCDENCTLLKENDILYQLLLCELDTSPISEVSMIESTTTVELSEGHNLHVNHKLFPNYHLHKSTIFLPF